jgi:hypothetical protein
VVWWSSATPLLQVRLADMQALELHTWNAVVCPKHVPPKRMDIVLSKLELSQPAEGK